MSDAVRAAEEARKRYTFCCLTHATEATRREHAAFIAGWMACASEPVTEEQVEAAAESLWLTVEDCVPAHEIAPWANVEPGTKDELRRQARAAIEAARKA